MSLLTDKQIQAQVTAIRRSLKNGAQHVAIRSSSSERQGADRMVIDGAEHLVLSCVSDLQVREALLAAERESLPSVLLCSMPSESLGDDVIDRLAKRRIFAPQVREIVAELFAVAPSRMDPRLLKTKPLMDALITHLPSDGYPPVAGGVLDLQTAWLTLLSRLLGEQVRSPSLTHFLDWSLIPSKWQRLAELAPDLRAAFVDWFAGTRGESVRFMMSAIESGFGNDLVPIGVVLGLVFDSEHQQDPEHQAARGRLERFFNHRAIDTESTGAWSRAAVTVLAQMKSEDALRARRLLLSQCDTLIEEMGLLEKAWLSDHSPRGLEQRYQQVGLALKKALRAKSSSPLGEVREGITRIQQHLLGDSGPERLERVVMASRLIRWLKTSDPNSPENFEQVTKAYHQDGGFVDWARHCLKERDESPKVQEAYDAIIKKADERAHAFEKDFGVLLKEWTRSDSQSDELVLIEDVLSKVVTPIAKHQPVLLLVMDGMSVAVFRSLLQDMLRHEWTEIVNEQEGLPRPTLATLPSITNISRRALFLGRLDPGTNGTEEGEFKNNDLLFQGSGSQVRPKLFKMGDLSEKGRNEMAPKLRSAIADKKCRVVSVVINAIDNHLDSGKQIRLDWNLNRIPVMRDILRQAAEAGRLVIMTSDHGHMLDFGTKQLPSVNGEIGDRFRAATGAVEEGEIEYEGSRVRKAYGHEKITLPWSNAIRYCKGKRGYHGGANPQEMVIPLAILSDIRSKVPEGWQDVPSYQPSWWRMDAFDTEPRLVTKPKPKAKPDEAVKGLDLFEHAGVETPEQEQGWVGALLKSAIYQDQCKLAVRGAPDKEIMSKLLTGLDSRGGTTMKQALAQELGMPPFRLDGLIQNVSRILNIDGYDVLIFDRSSETVSLNVDLLCTQFELEKT